MRHDDDILLAVVDAHETLVRVKALVSPELPEEEAGFALCFDRSMVFVFVDPELDEVRVTSSMPAGLERAIFRAADVWERAVGCSVLWAWTLVNQQGYGDGLQLAFHRPGTGVECVTIQLVGCASILEVHEVKRVTRSE